MTYKQLDYHNNDLVADLHHLLGSSLNSILTDWELLCAIANIVNKRKPPTSEMTDCQTGRSYQSASKEDFEKAFKVAKRNAGL